MGLMEGGREGGREGGKGREGREGREGVMASHILQVIRKRLGPGPIPHTDWVAHI